MERFSVIDAITLSALVLAVMTVSWSPGFRTGLKGGAIGPALLVSFGRSVVAVMIAAVVLAAGAAVYHLVKMCEDSMWEVERLGFWYQLGVDESKIMPISCPTCRVAHDPTGIGIHTSARAAGYIIGFVAPVLSVLAAIPSCATTFLGWHFGTQQRIRDSLMDGRPCCEAADARVEEPV